MEEELKENNYLEEEVFNISKSIAPWIPYIGLTLAGISIGKYAYTRYLRHRQNAEETLNPEVPNKQNDKERDPDTGTVSSSNGAIQNDN